MKKLKDSVRLMKMAYSLSGKYLDVCYLQTTVSQISEKVVVYYMTLLAHAAVHQRLEMVKFLIKEGASMSIMDTNYSLFIVMKCMWCILCKLDLI